MLILVKWVVSLQKKFVAKMRESKFGILCKFL